MSGVVYCPKCHQEAYRLDESKDAIKVIRKGNTLINVNRESSVSMNVSCPNGHLVKLEIKPEEAKVKHG